MSIGFSLVGFGHGAQLRFDPRPSLTSPPSVCGSRHHNIGQQVRDGDDFAVKSLLTGVCGEGCGGENTNKKPNTRSRQKFKAQQQNFKPTLHKVHTPTSIYLSAAHKFAVWPGAIRGKWCDLSSAFIGEFYPVNFIDLSLNLLLRDLPPNGTYCSSRLIDLL